MTEAEKAKLEADRRKESAEILRKIASDIEAGTADAFAVVWRGKCERQECTDRHPGYAIQSFEGSEMGHVWMLGGAALLGDMVMREYHGQQARAAMAPVFDALRQHRAQSEAAEATKQ